MNEPGADTRRDLPEPPDDPTRFRDPLAGLVKRIGIKWWGALLVGLLVFGVGEKLLLPLVQGYLNLDFRDPSTLRPDIEALVNGFLLVPTILAAYVWQIDGVHKVFVQFARGESFADRAAFDAFMRKAARWAKQPWWIAAIGVAVVGVLWQNFWLWDPVNPKPVAPWWSDGEPLSRVVALTLALPGWYLAAQIVLGQVRLAWTLRKLWSELGEDYNLDSKGRAGGVRSLSHNVSILATVGAVVLLNLILGLLLPQMRDTAATPDFVQWAVIIWAAYLIVVPGITLVLLWPAHKTMDKKKTERIERVAKTIDDRYDDAEEKIDSAQASGVEIEELDRLRKLRDWLEEDLPSWPLPEPLRAVSWSTVVPISLTVLTIVLDRFA